MKIVNVLNDGTIKDDLTGYVIKSEMSEFYNILKELSKGRTQNENEF